MNCPECESVMEREDSFNYNGLYQKLIPAATYLCPSCKNVYYWQLGHQLIADIDNRKSYTAN